MRPNAYRPYIDLKRARESTSGGIDFETHKEAADELAAFRTREASRLYEDFRIVRRETTETIVSDVPPSCFDVAGHKVLAFDGHTEHTLYWVEYSRSFPAHWVAWRSLGELKSDLASRTGPMDDNATAIAYARIDDVLGVRTPIAGGPTIFTIREIDGARLRDQFANDRQRDRALSMATRAIVEYVLKDATEDHVLMPRPNTKGSTDAV